MRRGSTSASNASTRVVTIRTRLRGTTAIPMAVRRFMQTTTLRCGFSSAPEGRRPPEVLPRSGVAEHVDDLLVARFERVVERGLTGLVLEVDAGAALQQ